MKTRSITSRNLAGGFLGGVLGIFSFKLIYPLFLPLGCIIGVIGGYLYQEIWQYLCQIWKGILKEPANEIDENKSTSVIMQQAKIILRHILTIAGNISGYAWLKADPINRAYSIKWLITSILAITYIPVMYYIFHFFLRLNFLVQLDKENQAIIGSVYAACVFVPLLLTLVVINVKQDKNLSGCLRTSSYYLECSRYSRGILRYAREEVWFFVRTVSALFAMLIINLGYFLLLGGLFMVIIFLPALILIISLKGIYQITREAKPWICLCITLAITITSAHYAKFYMDDTIWLWLIALMTGTLSGLTSEGMRRLIEVFFRAHENFTAYTTSPIKQHLPYKLFLSTGSKLLRKFESPLSPLFSYNR